MIATITNIKRLNDRDYLYDFDCADIAQKALPGQFVEVKVSKSFDPFLRRPFSIYGAKGNTLQLLVRMVGKGTKLMSEWRVGDQTDILGPLGNTYAWTDEDAELIVVGGGIGFAPINYLIEQLLQDGKKVHLLFSPKRESELIEHLVPGDNLKISVAGNRTEIKALLDEIISGAPEAKSIFCCGPDGLMKLVAETGIAGNIPTQLSMEAMMGCGINICGGCIIPVKDGDDFTYKKVCADGPVFSGEEVIFDE